MRGCGIRIIRMNSIVRKLQGMRGVCTGTCVLHTPSFRPYSVVKKAPPRPPHPVKVSPLSWLVLLRLLRGGSEWCQFPANTSTSTYLLSTEAEHVCLRLVQWPHWAPSQVRQEALN